ncbi:MAG: hypothetical protein JXQ87_04485 [Bacteroidia bacterium]
MSIQEIVLQSLNKVQENVFVVGEKANIKIGEGAKINNGAYLNCGGRSYGGAGSISIGENSIVGAKTTLFAGGGSIDIGELCDIRVGALLLSYSRKSKFNPANPNYDEMFDHTSIKIGKCCNITSGAIVLGNTDLGDFCIVAAGAVVQGKYPNRTTIVAQPSRQLPRFVDNN